ncbi:hypothetical protein Dimus_031674 [Dionaea muscipula]
MFMCFGRLTVGDVEGVHHVHEDSEIPNALRLTNESLEVIKKANPDQQTFYAHAYVVLIEGLKDLSMTVDATIRSVLSRDASSGVPRVVSKNMEPKESQSNTLNLASQLMVLDPHISQTKGRKKDVKGKGISDGSSRIKSGIELMLGKKKRLCKQCNQFAQHDKPNYPQNPNWRKRQIEENDHDSHDLEEDGEDVQLSDY